MLDGDCVNLRKPQDYFTVEEPLRFRRAVIDELRESIFRRFSNSRNKAREKLFEKCFFLVRKILSFSGKDDNGVDVAKQNGF